MQITLLQTYKNTPLLQSQYISCLNSGILVVQIHLRCWYEDQCTCLNQIYLCFCCAAGRSGYSGCGDLGEGGQWVYPEFPAEYTRSSRWAGAGVERGIPPNRSGRCAAHPGLLGLLWSGQREQVYAAAGTSKHSETTHNVSHNVYTLRNKASYLASLALWRTFNIQGTFPFHKRIFRWFKCPLH